MYLVFRIFFISYFSFIFFNILQFNSDDGDLTSLKIYILLLENKALRLSYLANFTVHVEKMISEIGDWDAIEALASSPELIAFVKVVLREGIFIVGICLIIFFDSIDIFAISFTQLKSTQINSYEQTQCPT